MLPNRTNDQHNHTKTTDWSYIVSYLWQTCYHPNLKVNTTPQAFLQGNGKKWPRVEKLKSL